MSPLSTVTPQEWCLHTGWMEDWPTLHLGLPAFPGTLVPQIRNSMWDEDCLFRDSCCPYSFGPCP